MPHLALATAASFAFSLTLVYADLHKTLPGRPNVKAPLRRPGRNRLQCNDFHCMRQFASGMLCGRLGPHNPPLRLRNPTHPVVDPCCWLVREQPL